MAKIPKYIDIKHPFLEESFRTVKNTEDAVASALKYVATERDLFLCDYPKCGVTWLQYIVWCILHDGDPPQNKLRNNIPFLELDGREKVEVLDKKEKYNIIKTHFPYKWIPKHQKAKYIFIARNPKDVCVSLYYHTKGFGVYEFHDGTFGDFFDVFVNGKAEVGDYCSVLKEYYLHRNDLSFLFLLYEDLITDTRKTVLAIAEFLGKEYCDKLKENNELLLKKVLKETSFDSMQSKTDILLTGTRPKHLPFIRKGIIGDWMNHMNNDQARLLDKKLVTVSEGSGCESLWKRFSKCQIE